MCEIINLLYDKCAQSLFQVLKMYFHEFLMHKKTFEIKKIY